MTRMVGPRGEQVAEQRSTHARARARAKVVGHAAVVPMVNDGTRGSRERILEAALSLMADKGYAGTSMSMITKRSGLPASSTYWHFGSKEDLLAEVVEYSASRWLASMPRWNELIGTPDERLRQVLATGQAGTSEPFLRLLMLLALEAPPGGKWLQTIRRVRRSAAGGFRKAYDEIVGKPDDDESQRLREDVCSFALAATDGIFLATQIDEKVDVPRMFQLLERSFLDLCRSAALDRRA